MTDYEIGESFLFDDAQPVEPDNLDFANSMLFGGEQVSVPFEEEEQGPASGLTKQVKLFSGNTIRLKQKAMKISLRDLNLYGNYMDMDHLFSEVELRNTIKKNTDVLSETNKPVSLDSTIWTEKYRPNKFIDLCSAGNDKLYRVVLHWLKKWSKVVFGELSTSEMVDSMGRPHKKILLVHGASGIGKTSSVHLLAKQLGYNVEELNAANSMDTLPQAGNSSGNQTGVSAALKLKIMNALTSNTITSKGKPTCLVIDEIDSLVNAHEIVKVLNDLVYTDLRNLYRSKQETDKKKKKLFFLNRPIICIANDIYSSNRGFGPSPMERLRPVCDMVQFKKPTFTKGNKSSNAMRSIKDHLMMINQKENLGLDFQQVTEVSEICDGDIRACVNELQFSRKSSKDKGPKGEGNLKDSSISWFTMVDLLFQRDQNLRKEENFTALLDLFMNGNGKSTVSNSSSYEKVIRGCFNRYLDVVHHQDDSLLKPAELSDWLNFYDQFSNSMSDDIGIYPSIVGLKIWSMFSEMKRERIKESLIQNAKSIDFELFETMKQNRAVIKTIIGSLPLKTKLAVGHQHETYSSYFLPFLGKMFNVELSSKVKSNLKDHEKAAVEKLTVFVKDMNLTLENERELETGTVTLQISPNWDTITNFDNIYTQVPHTTLVKQMQIRRSNLFPLLNSELERLEMIRLTLKRKADPILVEKKETKKRLKVSSVDFFKGQYDGLANQLNKPPVDTTEVTRIWVKYHEGFSSAVRKNIGWNDIWLP